MGDWTKEINSKDTLLGVHTEIYNMACRIYMDPDYSKSYRYNEMRRYLESCRVAGRISQKQLGLVIKDMFGAAGDI